MTQSLLDHQLDLLEAQCKELAASLVQRDPDLLQTTGVGLQQLAVELMQMAQGAQSMPLKSVDRTQRIRALASGLGVLRENLLRQSAYVDRALGLLVPAAGRKATYAGGGGAFDRQGRHSGAFTVFSA